MKYLFLTTAVFVLTGAARAQRPATQAEHDEDARVLKIISAAMPHDIDEAPDPEERSNNGIGGNSSDMTGINGFHSNTNFATRDVFEHYYKIDYHFTKIPAALADKLNPRLDEAKKKMDEKALEWIDKLTNCTVMVSINHFSFGNNISSYYPIKKINSPYSNLVYQDSKGYATILFFGEICKPALTTAEEDGANGGMVKKYAVADVSKLQAGTVIQTIAVSINADPDIAAFIMQQIDWQKIKNLPGTGKIEDATAQNEHKKYFTEQPITPVAGNNMVSFSYVDEAGNEKTFSASSAKHDLPNCAILRNHNENPKVLEHAETTLRITDDKDPNRFFHASLPIVRTTGTVTATFDSNHDYEVMWGASPGSEKGAQVFFPDNIEITITRWAPPGGFIEGIFSGTATTADPADLLSSTRIKYNIKNGKFKMRRIANEGAGAGL